MRQWPKLNMMSVAKTEYDVNGRNWKTECQWPETSKDINTKPYPELPSSLKYGTNFETPDLPDTLLHTIMYDSLHAPLSKLAYTFPMESLMIRKGPSKPEHSSLWQRVCCQCSCHGTLHVLSVTLSIIMTLTLSPAGKEEFSHYWHGNISFW